MFDPRKTTIIEVQKIQREIFWSDMRLYFKVLGIVGAALAMALWLILEKLG